MLICKIVKLKNYMYIINLKSIINYQSYKIIINKLQFKEKINPPKKCLEISNLTYCVYQIFYLYTIIR